MRSTGMIVSMAALLAACSDGEIGANEDPMGQGLAGEGWDGDGGGQSASAGRGGRGQIGGNSGGSSNAGQGAGSGSSEGGRANSSGGTGTAGSNAVPAPPGLESIPQAAIDAQTVDPGISLPDAPGFGASIRYVPNRSSVRLYVPGIEGAGDYRAFAIRDGVSVSLNGEGGEQVDGGTIFCAGLRQHNHCDGSEAITEYGRGAFHVPPCSQDDRALDVQKSVVTNIQLDGVTEPTTVVVEAIDRLCPFPGTFGVSHSDVECVFDGRRTASATVDGQVVSWPLCPPRFPIRTAGEIRADYGSLIINGHGPAPHGSGESPFANIGLPAPAVPPSVLARSVIRVEPIGTAGLPEGFTDADFFEGFDSGEQPTRVNGVRIIPSSVAQNPQLHQTSQISMYTYGAESPQFFVTHGALRSVLPDWSQNIMGSNVLYPRRAFAVPDDAGRFLHVTFETQANATDRRYFWFHACGAATAGQTMVNGALPESSGIVPAPGFMNPQEGEHISMQGWNCIQLVPRGGGYETLGGGLFGRSRPGTDIRVVINADESGSDFNPGRQGSVTNVSPNQYGGRGGGDLDGTWVRQWDQNKGIVGVMLDDQMYIEQRTKFDVYFNRERIVVYANGVQKLCNDYSNQRLTMAESAIGIGHVLYHSSAEREEFVRQDYIRTSQHYYRHNTPFLDHRTFDNVGVRENAELPAGFATGQCYSAN